MNWLEKEKKEREAEQERIRAKDQEEAQQKEKKVRAYMANKDRIDAKIAAIENYAAEVNNIVKAEIITKITPGEIIVRQNYYKRKIVYTFQNDDVEFYVWEDGGTENWESDKDARLNLKLDDISTKQMDPYFQWFANKINKDDLPIKLRSDIEKNDAKLYKIIGICVLIFIAVVAIIAMYARYVDQPPLRHR